MKKILTLLLSILMLSTLVGCGSTINTINKEVNTKEGLYKDQTIILHTNDVHGAVEGYSYLPPLKKALEDQGATVILVDAGDYVSGSAYVAASKGESAITLMNQAGYDLATLGNHEFDFGYTNLKNVLSKATFKVLCSDIFDNGKTIFDGETIVKVGDLKIGFIGVSTPENLTKSNPDLFEGLTMPQGEELFKLVQEEVNKVKKEADIVVVLAHLGIDDESIGQRSYDLYKNVEGIDFIIDAHSHSVMIHGENGEPIQSTGTAFENIGVIVIDNKTKEIVKNELIPTNDLDQDTDVLATAQNVIKTVDDQYSTVVATSEVDLNGVKEVIRCSETNLGDLITDATLWSAKNETDIKVDDDHIVAILNSGCMRTSISKGEVTRKNIFDVLPFGNTVSINYCSGKTLLNILEASTFMTPEIAGGFPQISGMKIELDTTIPYDAGEVYPDSTYYAPKSIKRVKILEINGKPFNENDTYCVVSSNFLSAGGDTYYELKEGRTNGNCLDLPITLDSAATNYITTVLQGVIGKEYENPQGRINIIVE